MRLHHIFSIHLLIFSPFVILSSLLLLYTKGSQATVIKLVNTEKDQAFASPVQLVPRTPTPTNAAVAAGRVTTLLQPQPRGLGKIHTFYPLHPAAAIVNNPVNYDVLTNTGGIRNHENDHAAFTNTRIQEGRKLHFDPDFLQPNDVQIKDNQHPPFNSGRHSTSNEYKPDFITYFPREEYDSSSSLTDDFYSHPGKSTRDKVDTKKELVENSYKSQSDDSSPIIIIGDLYGTTEKESDHLDLHLAMSENDNLVSNSSKSNNNETQTEATESLLRIQKEEQEQAQGEELTQNYFNSFSSFYPYSSSQEEEGPNTICNDSGLLQPNSSPSKSNQEIETPTDLIKPTSSSSSSEIQMPSSMLTFFYSSTIAPKKIPTTTLRTTSSQIEGNFYHHHSTNIKNYIEGDDDDDQEKIKQGTSSSSTSSSSEEFKDNEDVVDVDGDDDSLKDVVGVNSHQNQALVKRVSTSLAAAVGFVIVSILTVAIALLTNVNNFHLGDQQRNNIRKRKRTNNNNNNINLHHNHITSNYKPSQPQKAAFPLLFPSSSLFSNNNINHIKNNGTRIHFPTQLETFFHHLESASSLNDFNDNNFHMFKKDFK